MPTTTRKPTSMRSARARWKASEREIAALLGGVRVPITGRTRGSAPDIEHKWLGIEVKSRIARLLILQEMMDQASKAAEFSYKRDGVTRLPVGIYHVVGTRYDKAFITMRLGDFLEWFGDQVDAPGGADVKAG